MCVWVVYSPDTQVGLSFDGGYKLLMEQKRTHAAADTRRRNFTYTHTHPDCGWCVVSV